MVVLAFVVAVIIVVGKLAISSCWQFRVVPHRSRLCAMSVFQLALGRGVRTVGICGGGARSPGHGTGSTTRDDASEFRDLKVDLQAV